MTSQPHDAATANTNDSGTRFDPPHPGCQVMPRWDGGELPEPPKVGWRGMLAIIGPGVVMGAAAIGGGEWLTGPLITARYGGALLWLATLSILGQVVYNVEISRYTLYCGEPIFTGKFRVPPHPLFWVFAYLLLDFGSFLPYLISNAAVPLLTIVLGHIPSSDNAAEARMLLITSCILFVVVLLPLVVGGKVFNSLKVVMSFKLIFVLSFLTFLALFFSTPKVWYDLTTGFFKFGNYPTISAEDTNGNGVQDKDEAKHVPKIANAFDHMARGEELPPIDWSIIGFVAAMAAIAGNGGLTNTPISTYTRDQGWGMGRHVGAVPTIVGGHGIQLSHTGMVFPVNESTLERWRGWIRHVAREQWTLWLPACFVGLALPSMLSAVFLPPRTILTDKNLAAVMTADGVEKGVNETFGVTAGRAFWYLTLGCGVLVLASSGITTADGVLRRWIDVFWTGVPQVRNWDTKLIGPLYFAVLAVYTALGLFMLIMVDQKNLVLFSTISYNFVLGFSCFHVVAVNLILLPRQLRPKLPTVISLIFSGIFFTLIAIMATYAELPKIRKALGIESPPMAVAPATPNREGSK